MLRIKDKESKIMTRKSLLVLLLMVTAVCSYSQGFLKAEGKYIVDEKGNKIILRGMGLGGWMLQEGYMFRLGNIGQQHRIKAKIADVVGADKADQFYNEWLLNHTTKKDVDSMAAWGFNSIRLPMHYNLYTLPVEKEPVAGENTWIDKGFTITDSLLAWCKANKMYLILDLHAAPGGQGNDLAISDRDTSKPSLWQSEANQQKTIALWKKLAQRYAAEPWIGGYDIINEPNWGFEDVKDFRGTAEKKNEPLRKLMMDITKAIREVDTKHLIIIEGNGFGNNYNGVLPTWDNNMALSFHKYGNFNTDGAIKSFIDLREKYNVPLWMGESGENSNNWFTHAIQLAERNSIGWAWWQEKKMGINNPLEIVAPQGYDKLVKYWSGKGDKPSAEEAWATLQQLIENIKIENNVYHKDVPDAMFRQVNSAMAIPFKNHNLTTDYTMLAADYDMGRQGVAYYDKDTASYQYTPGVRTAGNRGRSYRNDGVDIELGNDGPFISYIEEGEWLQYTIAVEKSGKYNISFEALADSANASLSVMQNEKLILKNVIIKATPTSSNWQWTAPQFITLSKGTQQLKIKADTGGYRFRKIRFVKI
jgi:aryl-phospho-beta-D-glucosidase BglC (GH1 family)